MTLSSPHAAVEIDGTVWDSWQHPGLFARVSVNLATDEASEGIWETFDPDLRMINKYSTASGVPLVVVRIWLGFAQELGEPVFKGLLARVERGEGKTLFRVYDMALKMRLIKKTGYHKGDDLKIIKKLVERHQPLKFSPPDKPIKLPPHRSMPQDEQTDWEHALERAREAGLLLYVRHDTVFARYPAKTAEKPMLTIAVRDQTMLRDLDLIFKVPENQDGAPKKVTVRGRGRGGKRLTGVSDESKRGNEPVSIKRDLPQHTKKYTNARAQAQKALDREHAFSASIRTIAPLPSARPDVGDTIELANVGLLFSGKYVADQVNHDLSPGRLITSYELHRDVKE